MKHVPQFSTIIERPLYGVPGESIRVQCFVYWRHGAWRDGANWEVKPLIQPEPTQVLPK